MQGTAQNEFGFETKRLEVCSVLKRMFELLSCVLHKFSKTGFRMYD